MHRGHGTASARAVRRWAFAIVFASCAPLTSCDRPAEEAGSAPSMERTEELLAATLQPHPDFTWSPVEGAAAYRVRAWAGDRLLFDAKTPRPRLASTPAIERPLAFYPEAVLRIQAESADGARVGEVIEISARAVRSKER